MKDNYTITETPDFLRVEIQARKKPVLRIGLLIQGILFLGLTLFFGFLVGYAIYAITYANILSVQMTLILLLTIILFVLFALASRTYFINVYTKEIVSVDKKNLIYTKRTILFSRTQKFENYRQLSFTYVGENTFTKHPMSNDTIDSTGLGVTEREVQFLIKDGTMAISNGSTKMLFGRDIPSWDAKAIIACINKFISKTSE
jgi:hypothetical protein